MFVLQSLAQLCMVFWVSALVAEGVMRSTPERALAPALRVGFGYFLSLAFFSAALLVFSLAQAWALGALLLVLYAFGTGTFPFAPAALQRAHAIGHGYLKTFAFFIGAALFFFAPLIVSNTYGPFTEGGGDISIYADSAKYVHDHRLTQLGGKTGTLADVVANVRFAIRDVSERVHETPIDPRLNNPPAAEFATYRVITTGLNPFFSVPYVAYSLFSGGTTFPLYFGLQALMYALILGAVWHFFRGFGLRLSTAAVLLTAASHALISVHYNMFSMQAACIAASALIVAALPTVSVRSAAGARVYGPILLMVWLSYILYFSVILPVLAGVEALRGRWPEPSARNGRPPRPILATVAATVFLAMIAFVAWFGAADSLNLLGVLILGLTHGTSAAFQPYMGTQLNVLSLQWLSFFFGFLSQQHFQPFAIEVPTVNFAVWVGIGAGVASLLLGAVILLKARTAALQAHLRVYLVIYAIALVTVLVQTILARGNLYQQAKGAQNVLVYLYVAMVLPLAIGASTLRNDRSGRLWVRALASTLGFFFVTLLIAKGAYTGKLAFRQDRATILEPSYFSEAARIRQGDGNPFVLFEPRKSADLYVSIQPFFGTRMVAVRDLSLLKGRFNIAEHKWEGDLVFGSDLIAPGDLPHLWTLVADCGPRPATAGSQRCTWNSRKLTAARNPQLLLFGDDYERNYGPRPLVPKATPTGMFSYLRNGAALLYVPGGAAVVGVTLLPRDETAFAAMKADIARRVERGDFGRSVTFTANGTALTLRYRLPQSSTPRLVPIARYSGEYWLGVKVGGKDLI